MKNKETGIQMLKDAAILTADVWYAKYPIGDYFQYREEGLKRGYSIRIAR